jgi:hypothetical protein
VFNDPPVFPGRLDPNDRFRERRRRARRRRRLRGLAVLCVLVGATVALVLNARFVGGNDGRGTTAAATTAATTAQAAAVERARPAEIRGVHVTGPLVAAGKLGSYIALARNGLNTLEVDVKDETGDVAIAPAPALARELGAAKGYYDARRLARRVHAAGLYLIGRIVVFQDPYLAKGRPQLAVKRRDGSVWTTPQGLAWVSPYERAVWDYNLSIAEAAAKAGFDEIMFDYVRFPTDGDVAEAVFPGRAPEPRWATITAFAQAAAARLRPLGVRVGAALFGLAATRDLGIGQRPQLIGRYMDTIYAMTYPCLYGSGWYGIDRPWAKPGLTVSYSLSDFTTKLAGRRATLVPWLEDYDCGDLSYTPEMVAEQISATRRAQIASGFLLWNPFGVYTASALAPR